MTTTNQENKCNMPYILLDSTTKAAFIDGPIASITTVLDTPLQLMLYSLYSPTKITGFNFIGTSVITGMMAAAKAYPMAVWAGIVKYAIRDFSRECLDHPYIGAVVGGSVGYSLIHSNPWLGALNSFSYEYTNDMNLPYDYQNATFLENHAAMIAIEGGETLIKHINFVVNYKPTAEKYQAKTDINYGALIGTIGTFVGVPVIDHIYIPIRQYLEPAFITAKQHPNMLQHIEESTHNLLLGTSKDQHEEL